jgi:GTPase
LTHGFFEDFVLPWWQRREVISFESHGGDKEILIEHVNQQNGHRERVLLASRYSKDAIQHQNSLLELARLAKAAGAEVVGQVVQEREGIDSASFLGSGKVAEVGEMIKAQSIDLVIFDHPLSPTQNRNLEVEWKIKVLDRTGLILDIFARRAHSREGKLQVEAAQLSYLLPRLVGGWQGLSRLAGGIGTRGPGESKLEVDRRRARERITRIKKELRKVQAQKNLHKKNRSMSGIPVIALVGYTNAGKSTLMNQLAKTEVLTEDNLFATLDPTMRRIRLPSGREVIITDTVGFVRQLPHELVESFKTTFQGIEEASLLLHVIDTSEPQVEDQMQTVESVLNDMGLADKSCINVFNKIDRVTVVPDWLKGERSNVSISARSGLQVDQVLAMIDQWLLERTRRITLLFPYEAGGQVNEIYRSCRVLDRKDQADGIRVTAEMRPDLVGKYESFIQSTSAA